MEYRLIRSNRKTIAIEIKADGALIVRAPYAVKKAEIERLLIKKAEWIEKSRRKISEKMSEEKESGTELLSREEIRLLADKALRVIPERVAYFAPKVGVTYGRITIRNQKTRWGSCSSKGNLNFNCLLMLAPPAVVDYVVVHELCHRKEMNHSKAFWAEVGKILPDYALSRKWLKEHGGEIMRKMVT